MKGMLTNSEVQLVQTSWLEILSRQKDFAEIFYSRLFDDAPELRKYFKLSKNERNIKFVSTLSLIVNKLHKGQALYFDVKYLGERHINYGALPEHYTSVGSALITALKEGLGNSWDDDIEFAWIKLYTSMSDAMIKVYQVNQNKQFDLANVMDGNNR